MVKLKRVCERYDHIRSLENLLKFYSRNPDNWDKEWSVNPYYIVDLKKYGAGHCVCGHPIRYQYQFLNTVTGRTFPVGSECVHLLHLAKFDETVDKLEKIAQMANAEIDTSLKAEDFIKAYKKIYDMAGVSALTSYGQYKPDPTDLFIYRNSIGKRKYKEYAEKMKAFMIELHDEAKKFVNSMERKSKPVTPDQVQQIVDDSAAEMLRFAQAKQNKLPF